MSDAKLVCPLCGSVYEWDTELPAAANLCPECVKNAVIAA